MKEKLARNILVSIGSSIGIMSVILMLSIGNGIETYIIDTMNENTNPKLVEVNKTSTDFTNPSSALDTRDQILSGDVIPFTDKEINKLTSIKHVSSYEKGYAMMAFSDKVKMNDKEILIQNLTTISKGLLTNALVEGKLASFNEVMISPRLANKLNKDYSKLIGNEITLIHMVNDKEVKGNFIISGIYDMGTPLAIIYVNYNNLETMYQNSNLTLEPTTLYLYASKDIYRDTIKKQTLDMGYSGSLADTFIKVFTKMLDVISYVLAAIAGISLFVSAIMILVVLYISVVERTSEIGVLKAIGARRKDIRRIFVTEAFLIGLAGGIVGVIGAFIIQTIGNIATTNLFDVKAFMMTFSYAIFGIITSIIVSVIAGLFPSAKAAKLDPIESLRHE